MPWGNIGECGSAKLHERDRMVAEVELGVNYIKLVCGEPPPGCEAAVMWHEHDFGEYATVGLFWEPFEISDAPWNYISRAEEKLSRFDDSVDWSPLPDSDEDEGNEDDEQERDPEIRMRKDGDNEASSTTALLDTVDHRWTNTWAAGRSTFDNWHL